MSSIDIFSFESLEHLVDHITITISNYDVTTFEDGGDKSYKVFEFGSLCTFNFKAIPYIIVDSEAASCINDVEKIEALVHSINSFYFVEVASLEHSFWEFPSYHLSSHDSSYLNSIGLCHYLKI